MTELEFCRQADLLAVVKKNKQIKHMKIIKHLTFGTLAVLAATLFFQTSITRADAHSQRGGDNERGNQDQRNAIITWTKHVTAFLPPGGEIFGTIAGVAEGDLGDGTLTGDAFNPVEVLLDGSVTFEAEYRLVGPKHSFTVHFRTVQAPDNSGVITGVVTDGWLKGNEVVGQYTARSCNEGVNLTCFDGTFVILKGSKSKNDKD